MARGLEILLAVLTVGLSTGGPATADPLVRDFAVCAGRFSALVEHQWLVDGPASEASARQRDSLVSLVEAAAGPEQASTVLAWRIDAKVSHKRLLERAWFADDPLARMRSAQLLQACADLIGQS